MATNNPTALDFNDLIYYDKKIKQYVDDKAEQIASIIPDTYTKDELDSKLNTYASKSAIIGIDKRIDAIAENVAANTASIVAHREELDDIEARIINLERDDVAINSEIANLKVALENKADESDIPSIEGLATEEYVRAKIAEAELAGGDIDLSSYYTKSETDSAIQAAIDNISQPDLSEYVTKEEFQRVSDQSAANNKLILDIGSELVRIDDALENIPTKTSELENDSGFISEIPSEYVTESELESKGYITEHQSLENYATKEFVEESIDNIVIPDTSKFVTMDQVEAQGYLTEVPDEFVTDNELRDALNSIDIPEVDLTDYYTKEETEALIPTNYATKDDLENLVTVEYITENYVTTEQVGETVAQQVAENTEIQQSIAQEVAKQIETINYGTFGELE